MASVAIRQQKQGAFYYAQVKRDGKWTWVPTGIEAMGKRTHSAAIAFADAKQKQIDEEAKNPPQPQSEVKMCGPLLEEWLKALDNRSADNDRCRGNKYLVPRFKDLPVTKLTKGEVVTWLRELKAGELAGGSRKKLFTLLSRFCSWLSAGDNIDANPCRNVPTTERPQDDGKKRRPWLDDEAKVRAMMFALGPTYGLMFATARTGGLRLCETAGLRVGDTDSLESGVLHVRYSYDVAMLKEDKGRGPERKDKWSPIHDPTVAAALLALAQRRRDAGAKEDDRLFDHLSAKPNAIRVACSRRWRKAATLVGVTDLSWYESSRHSFASKALASGARYEEVSKALGHGNVNTTARYYDRHVEQKFASLPKSDLGASLPEGKVIRLPAKKAATAP
jgi:integrase